MGQGRSWVEISVARPKDQKPRAEAMAALDNAIERFRAVAGSGNNPTLADNHRFRLAEALADRADLEVAGSEGRRTREAEVLQLLDQGPTETGLAGFWHLLKADLLRRLKKPAEAELEIAEAEGRTRSPAGRDRRGQYPDYDRATSIDDAVKSLDASPLDKPVKALWGVRRLAQLAGLPAGAGRFKAESELFARIKELRAQSSPEQRQAMLDLAKSSLVLDPNLPPEAWDALADAYGLAGEPARAGAEMMRAAERAAAMGNKTQAAAYRLRGRRIFVSGRRL